MANQILKPMSVLKPGHYFSFEGRTKVYKYAKSWRRGYHCYHGVNDVWGDGFTTPKTTKRKIWFPDF